VNIEETAYFKVIFGGSEGGIYSKDPGELTGEREMSIGKGK